MRKCFPDSTVVGAKLNVFTKRLWTDQQTGHEELNNQEKEASFALFFLSILTCHLYDPVVQS